MPRQSARLRVAPDFPSKIKIIRKAIGMTMEELSLDLEFDRSLVSYWESGKKVPSVESAWRLIQYLRDYGYKLTLEDIYPEPHRGE